MNRWRTVIGVALLLTLSDCAGNEGVTNMKAACNEVASMSRAINDRDAESYVAHWNAASDYAKKAHEVAPEWDEAEELSGFLNRDEQWDAALRAGVANDICLDALPNN